jgi:hypothetical protein
MNCINLYNLIFENFSICLPTFNHAPDQIRGGREGKWTAKMRRAVTSLLGQIDNEGRMQHLRGDSMNC